MTEAMLSAAVVLAAAVPLALPHNAQLLFGTEGPRSLPSDHVLRGHVALEPIAGAPDKIGGFLLPITKAKELNEGLRLSLSRAGMLAEGERKPIFRLEAAWQSFDAPLKISASSRAETSIHYQLKRIDTGAVIFARTITTSSESKGGDAADRLQGVARLAILTNFASAIACIDKASYGQAPMDCALKPAMTYRARQPTVMQFVPR
jgi:hypothetical protein